MTTKNLPLLSARMGQLVTALRHASYAASLAACHHDTSGPDAAAAESAEYDATTLAGFADGLDGIVNDALIDYENYSMAHDQMREIRSMLEQYSGI